MLDIFLALSEGDVLPLDAFAVHDSSAFAEREALPLSFLKEELARHSLLLPMPGRSVFVLSLVCIIGVSAQRCSDSPISAQAIALRAPEATA